MAWIQEEGEVFHFTLYDGRRDLYFYRAIPGRLA